MLEEVGVMAFLISTTAQAAAAVEDISQVAGAEVVLLVVAVTAKVEAEEGQHPLRLVKTELNKGSSCFMIPKSSCLGSDELNCTPHVTDYIIIEKCSIVFVTSFLCTSFFPLTVLFGFMSFAPLYISITT